MAYSKGSLVLTRATLDDLPTFPAVCFQPFHTEPYFKKMIPDTPANQEWWRKYYKSALLDPKTHMVKVTDQQNGKIVAFASWLLPRDDDGPQPGSGEDRWAEFTEDFDKSLADALFGSMAQARDKFMGDRKHYFLEFLGTLPEYKGRGAGTLMMRYGCDMADKDGLEAYVDSSMEGYPMYLKYDFVLKAEALMPGDLGYVERHLVRPPKKQWDS